MTRLILFFFLFSFIFKSFAFADEARHYSDGGQALNALQQEIILAKQKQQAFSERIHTAQVSLDQERSRQLEEEARRLMEEVSSRKEFNAPSHDGAAPEKQPKKPKIQSVKKKPWYESFPNPFTRNRTKFELSSALDMDENRLTDGEALYKVAVSDKKIALAEAVDIALANNAQMQADRKKIRVAEAKLAEAKRALFPTVQGTFDTNGGRSPTGGRQYKGQSQKINIAQPLYYGGELVNTVRQGEEALKQAKAEYEKNRNEFIHLIRIAYYGAVKAEYNAQYQTELEAKVGEIYSHAKIERGEKLIPEVDYLNVESQRYQVAFQAEASRNDVLSSAIALKATMGLAEKKTIPIDLALHFRKSDAGFDELLSLAFHNNADLKIKLHSLAGAYYGVEVYRSRKLPRIDLRGSFGHLAETFDDENPLPLDLEKEWFLGLHGSMPLGANSVDYDFSRHFYGPTISAFQGSEDWRHRFAFNLLDKLSDATDTENAVAAYLQTRSDYEKSKNDVTLKIREDFYNMQKSMIQVDSAMAKIRYQEKQSALLKYLSGLQETGVTNYAESLIQHAQDRFSFIQAVTDYEIAKSSLGVSAGDPYYFESPDES